jgi:hypothetical protein
MPQTTIVTALNGSLNLLRVPRPRPRLKPSNQLSSSSLNSRVGARTTLPNGTEGRRWEGGLAEQSVLSLFTECQRQFADGIDAYKSELYENGDPIPLPETPTLENTNLQLSITLYIHGGLISKGRKRGYHIGGLPKS